MRRLTAALIGTSVLLPAPAAAERHEPLEAVMSFALLWQSGRPARVGSAAPVPSPAVKPSPASGADASHAYAVRKMSDLWDQEAQLEIGDCLVTGPKKIDTLFTRNSPVSCIPSRSYELIEGSFERSNVTENFLCARWKARIGEAVREHEAMMIRQRHGGRWEWSFLAIRIR